MGVDHFRLGVDAALLIDSVLLFHESIKSYKLLPEKLNCDTLDSWQRGCTIINDMRIVIHRCLNNLTVTFCLLYCRKHYRV